MVCPLVIKKFLTLTRNKELAGLKKNKEILPFCICQVLVPLLFSKSREVPEKFFLLNVWVCYSATQDCGQLYKWPALPSSHHHGLHAPVSRSWSSGGVSWHQSLQISRFSSCFPRPKVAAPAASRASSPSGSGSSRARTDPLPSPGPCRRDAWPLPSCHVVIPTQGTICGHCCLGKDSRK